MRPSVPAEAFKRAAILKRKQQGAEAEGSKKKPRSQPPSAPLTVPQASTPPPPPRQSPTPTPPPQRSPLPPRRSPTPLPPPRRSPTPLPPRKSPPPTGPVSVAAGTSSEGPRAGAVRPADPSSSSAPESTPGGVAPAGHEASDNRKQRAVVGTEARLTSSEPTGETMGPIPMRPSVMNHPHLAEKLLSAASNSVIREEIRRTDSRTVFKECQAALLRVVNVFNHTQKLAINGEGQLRRYRREITEYKRRVTEAEDSLKLTRAGEAERLEIVRSQARAGTEAANKQMHKALERAVTAEGKLKAAEAAWADVKAQLEAAKAEVKSAEEKTEIAEEVARLADIKVAEAMALVTAADKRSAEAEAAAATAAEGKMAEAAAKAVESYRSSQAFADEVARAAKEAMESYRNSPAFVEEVAGAGADAFLHGYYECRSQALKIFGIEGLRDLEPSEDPEDGEIEQGSVPADAPSADAAPAED